MTGMEDKLKEWQGQKDPRKLFAHVWIIEDKHTKFSKEDKKHPWVMMEKKHPPDRFYKTSPVSTKRAESGAGVFLPAGTIWRLPCYIKIGATQVLHEEVIDTGEHKHDLPEYLKQEIIQKWNYYFNPPYGRGGRGYRKGPGK